jgi:hypothetical protein
MQAWFSLFPGDELPDEHLRMKGVATAAVAAV